MSQYNSQESALPPPFLWAKNRFLGATKHLYNWLCPSVGRSVGWVTHSFDDPHVAPYWPTWPCSIPSFLPSAPFSPFSPISSVFRKWTQRPITNCVRAFPFLLEENLLAGARYLFFFIWQLPLPSCTWSSCLIHRLVYFAQCTSHTRLTHLVLLFLLILLSHLILLSLLIPKYFSSSSIPSALEEHLPSHRSITKSPFRCAGSIHPFIPLSQHPFFLLWFPFHSPL